jgi:hypothetical protein
MSERESTQHGAPPPELRGRPPLYSRPMLRRNVALPPSHWDWLEEHGEGNRSAAIRQLVEDAMARG